MPDAGLKSKVSVTVYVPQIGWYGILLKSAVHRSLTAPPSSCTLEVDEADDAESTPPGNPLNPWY